MQSCRSAFKSQRKLLCSPGGLLLSPPHLTAVFSVFLVAAAACFPSTIRYRWMDSKVGCVLWGLTCKSEKGEQGALGDRVWSSLLVLRQWSLSDWKRLSSRSTELIKIINTSKCSLIYHRLLFKTMLSLYINDVYLSHSNDLLCAQIDHAVQEWQRLIWYDTLQLKTPLIQLSHCFNPRIGWL